MCNMGAEWEASLELLCGVGRPAHNRHKSGRDDLLVVRGHSAACPYQRHSAVATERSARWASAPYRRHEATLQFRRGARCSCASVKRRLAMRSVRRLAEVRLQPAQNGLPRGGFMARMRGMFEAGDFLDLKQFAFPELFDGTENVWDALKKLPEFVKQRLKPGRHGTMLGTPYIADDVFIGKGTVVEHGATIKGPAIIGENCQIRSSAYIRGD